jgi:hypothetical protein
MRSIRDREFKETNTRILRRLQLLRMTVSPSEQNFRYSAQSPPAILSERSEESLCLFTSANALRRLLGEAFSFLPALITPYKLAPLYLCIVKPSNRGCVTSGNGPSPLAPGAGVPARIGSFFLPSPKFARFTMAGCWPTIGFGYGSKSDVKRTSERRCPHRRINLKIRTGGEDTARKAIAIWFDCR